MTGQAILVLNLGLGPVFHPAAWRLDGSDARAAYDFATYRELARLAEDQKLHALFSADILALDPAQLAVTPVRGWEPFTFFAGLAAATERIGLIASVSTTFSEPFNLARQFTSLDRISGGRAGWNIVTSALSRAAVNFGLDALPEHDLRYERAEEFVQVVEGLWTGWDADALVADPAAGTLFDPARVRELDHVGEHFRVLGPLNTPPSPQGVPVLSQAGDSTAGRSFAARHAELVYTRHTDLALAAAYADELRARAAALGRPDGGIKILSGRDLIVGSDAEEARAARRALGESISLAEALVSSERATGVPLSRLPLDAPVPELPAEGEGDNGRGALAQLRRVVAQQRPSDVGALAEALRQDKVSSIVAGTAGQIADHFEEWLAAGVVDGFVLDPVRIPVDGHRILGELVPELRRRGLFRSDYEGVTLREDLGLPALTPRREELVSTRP